MPPSPVAKHETEKDIAEYGSTLVTIATTHHAITGDRTLIHLMISDPNSNPFARWTSRIKGARGAIESGDFEVAKGLLESALIDSKGLSGPGATSLLIQTWGTLGYCSFRMGNHSEALEQTRNAVDLSRTQGDRSAQKIYLNNLCHVCRALGLADAERRFAEELVHFV
jgi:hypothetical protein